MSEQEMYGKILTLEDVRIVYCEKVGGAGWFSMLIKWFDDL